MLRRTRNFQFRRKGFAESTKGILRHPLKSHRLIKPGTLQCNLTKAFARAGALTESLSFYVSAAKREIPNLGETGFEAPIVGISRPPLEFPGLSRPIKLHCNVAKEFDGDGPPY